MLLTFSNLIVIVMFTVFLLIAIIVATHLLQLL